ENRTITQSLNRVFSWRLEQFRGVGFRESKCRAFPPVNRGTLYLGDGIGLDVMMTDEVFEEARQRRQPAPNGRGLSLIDLAHHPFPGNHGAVVHFAQLVVGRDMERA